jgi:tripartite-type tricarboxylate transporter receptor subunit TctC
MQDFPFRARWLARLVRAFSNRRAVSKTRRAPSICSDLIASAVAALGVSSLPTLASAQDFYAGKTVSFIVSGSGAYEAYARLFAATMPKYIPGKPAMIVQVMQGGGGIRAGNFVYSIAPKDGTTIGATHGAVLTAKLLNPDVVDFDVTKFNWIGNATRDTYLVYVWHTAPIKTFEDARTTEVIMGGTNVGGAGIDMAIFARDLLGYKIKIVSGYKSSQESKLAMEKGEIHGTMGNAVSSLKATDWLETGKVRVLLQHGTKPHREFPNVPLFRSLVKDEKQRKMLDLIGYREEIAKPYFLPPGVPADRVAILRKAFEASLKDPDFLADIKRQRLDLDDSMTGEQLAELAKQVAATPPEVAKQLVDLFKNFKDK